MIKLNQVKQETIVNEIMKLANEISDDLDHALELAKEYDNSESLAENLYLKSYVTDTLGDIKDFQKLVFSVIEGADELSKGD